MHASRAARRRIALLVVAVRDERNSMVHRERLRQRLRGARRAHAVDRIGVDQPGAAEPAIQAAPRREHERDAARRQAARVQLRGPAADVVRLHVAQRQRRCFAAKPLQAIERLAVERQSARGEAPLDLQVVEMARDVGVSARPARHRRRRARSRRRQQPRQRRAGDLADAGEEVGAHVGAVARRVGRGEDEQAEGAASRRRGASGISASDDACPASSSHCTASKPVLTPQYGALRLLAKIFTSSLTARANGSAGEDAVAAPDAHRRLRDQELVLQLGARGPAAGRRRWRSA